MATRKITVTIPEELADKLEGLANKSEYVTEALRRRDRAERQREVFAKHGLTPTAEGVDKLRKRIGGRRPNYRRGGEQAEAA